MAAPGKTHYPSFMRLFLALAPLLLAAGAHAAAVSVPKVPGKFAGGDYGAAWRAWEGPMTAAFSQALGQKLTLSPELASFAPVLGAVKKDGGVPSFAPRSSDLALMTAQLAETGLKPADFAALPAEERLARMQEAHDTLRTELQGLTEALIKAGEEAEKQGDRGALHDAQSRLSLLAASHASYFEPQALNALRAARDKAFRAYEALAGAAVEGAAERAAGSLGGGAAAGKSGYAALDALAEPYAPRQDPHKAARAALLAPLEDGKVPAGFVEQFARYQQMGDPNLSFDGVRAFAKAAGDPFATGEDPARALQGLGLIAREAPASRARDLAVAQLAKVRFLVPDMETLRVFTLRDIALHADKENSRRILDALAEAAGPGREGPAGQALADAEAAWKANFGVPTPSDSRKSRERSKGFLKQGVQGLFTGGLGVLLAKWTLPAAAPAWLAWLGPAWPFLPFLGLVSAAVYLGLSYWFKRRAGPPR